MILLFSIAMAGLNLDNFLKEVERNNPNSKAAQVSQEASYAKQKAGDSPFIPQLNARVGYLLDYKNSYLMPTVVQTRSEALNYSLGVSQSFSTGTKVGVTGGAVQSSVSLLNSYSGDLPTSSYLAFTLTQSLWKDFFGQATELRRTRELHIQRLEFFAAEMLRQSQLVEAESAFWDYVYINEEVQTSQASLNRAKRIEVWVQRRTSTGIGDKSELMGAKALVAARELQLLNAKDSLENTKAKIAVLLGLSDATSVPELTGSLSERRSPESFVQGQGIEPIKMDAYMSYLEAQAKRTASLEVSESLKPDLALDLGYQTNGVDTSTGGALGRMSETDHPTYSAGLRLSWGIDTDVKAAQRRAAKLEAQAASLKSERLLLDARSAYRELLRRHGELTKKIELSKLVQEHQLNKAKAEQQRLSLGRTITSQVITAEEDAADAELNLIKMKAEQRKLETQGRMYIRINEDLNVSSKENT